MEKVCSNYASCTSHDDDDDGTVVEIYYESILCLSLKPSFTVVLGSDFTDSINYCSRSNFYFHICAVLLVQNKVQK